MKRQPMGSLSLALLCGVVMSLGARAGGETSITIAHLPQNTLSFQVQLVIENLLGQPRSLSLIPFDASGKPLNPVPVEIPAHTRSTFDPVSLFKGEAVAFFTIEGGIRDEPGPLSQETLTGVIAGLIYQYSQNPASAVFVPGETRSALRWRVYPGDWTKAFDGLAIVNMNACAGVEVVLHHFNAEGHLLQSKNINPGEGSFSKMLVNLAGELSSVSGSYVEVSANSPLIITALRGSLTPSDENSYLLGNTALAVPDHGEALRELEQNRAKWLGAGIDSGYLLQYRNLCFCPEEITRQVTLQVKQNWIQSFQYSDNGEPVPVEYYRSYNTVLDLFSLVEDAIANGVVGLVVEYDADWGYPTKIFIDQNTCLADEELLIETGGLQVIRN